MAEGENLVLGIAVFPVEKRRGQFANFRNFTVGICLKRNQGQFFLQGLKDEMEMSKHSHRFPNISTIMI